MSLKLCQLSECIGAGAAPVCEGRQPETGCDDLAGRRSPAGVLEESCFEEASTEAVFRLLLPNTGCSALSRGG